MAVDAQRDVEAAHADRGSWFSGPWFWVPFLMFMVYPASVGPAALACHSGMTFLDPVCEVVYSPILYAANHNTLCEKVFHGYIGLWGVRD